MGKTTTLAGELDELRAMVSATTSQIFLINEKLEVRAANPEALRSAGLEREDVIGRPFPELVLPGAPADELIETLRSALTTGRSTVKELPYTINGARRYRTYHIRPILDGDRSQKAVVTVDDTTALRASESMGEVLNRVNAAINSTMSFEEIMRRVVGASSKVMDSEASAIAMKEGDRWILRYRYGSIPEKAIGAALTDDQMRSCFLGQGRCATGVVDVRKADWVSQEMMKRFNVISFISVPLEFRSEIIGVLIFAFTSPREFSPEEIDFSTKLSAAVSLALENSNLYRIERDRRYLLQTILDNIPAVIIYMDGRDLSISWTNRYSDRYKFGSLAGENTVGLRLEDIIPNAEKTGVLHMFRSVARSGLPFYSDEFMLSGLGDNVIYWKGGLIPMQAPGRDFADLLILAVDVTENVNTRQRSEEAASAAERERRWLQTILDALPVGAAIIDRRGRVVEINPAAQSLWSDIIDGTPDLNDLDKVHAWDPNTGRPLRMEDWGIVKAVFQGETVINEIIALKTRSGRDMVMMMSGTPLRNEHDDVLGAVAIGQDVTGRIDLEREVAEAKDRAELYLDLLTHDINNLNAAAMGYLQLMRDREGMDERAKTWTGRSLEALEDSTRLIDNIRSIQRIESGEEVLSNIDLDEVLRAVASERADDPSGSTIEVTSRGRHLINANGLVREVFSNIVDNAIKHNPGPTRVSMRVSTVFEAGREAHRIDIEDNGPGIPDEDKEKIFNRAWRGGTKAKGRGLGLFLARRLVEDFNGQIWVEDRILGDHTKGARFVVVLPATGRNEG